MIKHFSIFYIGQIELEDVGIEGVPLAEFKEQIRLLGEEVMPAFTSTSAATSD